MPLTRSTVAAIDRRTKEDPDFAAAVETEWSRRKYAPAAVIVPGKAAHHIAGLADVKRIIDATHYVDVPHGDDDAIVRQIVRQENASGI